MWGAPERNPFFTVILSTLVEGGHVPPPLEAVPNPFSMARPDHTTALLEAAGFSAIREEEAPVEFRFRDVDDYFSFMAGTAGPIATVLQKLSEPDRTTVAAALEDALGAFEAGGEYRIPGAALVAAAS